MDEGLLNKIRDEFARDQEDLLLSLMRWAKYLIGDAPDAYGFTAEDVVGVAIERTLDPNCKRTWNPAKASLPVYLRGVIKSILSSKDLWKKRDRDPVNFRIDFPEGSDPEGPCSEEFESRSRLQLQAIEDTIQGDVELSTYYMASRESDKPAEIAELSGIKVSRIYELKRKLLGLIPQIRERHRELIEQEY